MFALITVLAVLAGAGAGRAGKIPGPPVLGELGAWATAGPRIGFVGTINHRQGLLVETFGSNQPRLLAPHGCGEGSEPNEVAAGPNGSWAYLTAIVSNSEAFYGVDLVLAAGKVRHVATAGGTTTGNSTTQPVDSIPSLLGDGTFLGYLHVTAAGVVQLMRVTPTGKPVYVADLTDLSLPSLRAPLSVGVDSGHLVVLDGFGSVHVYTTAGTRLATFLAKGAVSAAIWRSTIAVRTTNRQLLAYTLQGRLVHSYPLRGVSSAGGPWIYGGYAVYLRATKAVHAINLATGKDRIVARSGTGWFWNNASLETVGAVAPLTSQRSRHAFPVTLHFIPMAVLLEAVG